MNLSSSTVLLTGATGGIGQEIALQLIELGAHVIAVGRSQQALDDLNKKIQYSAKNSVCNLTCLQADLNQKQGREKIVNYCLFLSKDADKQNMKKQGGRINVLINNAGINHFGLFTELEDEQISQLIQLNTIVPMLLCKALIPLLEEKEQSAIINVGSTFGSIGFAGVVPYSSSKFALRGFSEALRRELANSNIMVKYIAPRATRTKFNTDKLNQMNQQLGNTVDSPKEVARSVVKAITQPKNEYFLGWPEKLFVKLNALLPRMVDRALSKKLKTIHSYASNQKTA